MSYRTPPQVPSYTQQVPSFTLEHNDPSPSPVPVDQGHFYRSPNPPPAAPVFVPQQPVAHKAQQQQLHQQQQPALTPKQRLDAAKVRLAELEVAVPQIDEEKRNVVQLLQEVQHSEHYNRTTGVGEDLQGHSVARLEVQVIEARDLPKMDMFSGKADPYAVVSVHPAAASGDKSDKRTETKWKNLNPVWDETFVIQPIVNRHNAFVKVIMMDAEKFGDDDFMAEIRIPLDALADQEMRDQWYDLADPDGKTVAEELHGQLHLRHQFIFSSVFPLEQRLEALENSKGEVLAEIAALQKLIKQLSSKSFFTPSSPKATRAPAVPAATPPVYDLEEDKDFLDHMIDYLHGDENPDNPDAIVNNYDIFGDPVPAEERQPPKEPVVSDTDCLIM